MNIIYRTSLALLLGSSVALVACSDDVVEAATDGTSSGTATETGDGDGDGDGEETNSGTQSGDGDGDSASGDGDGDSGSGDGDGDSASGDGDGDPATGDGDGDSGTGDGDGDTGTGDGDGDTGTGDGDGDTGTGDGDGDTGTGDGDGDTGDGDGDGEGACSDGCGQPNCGPCPEGPDPVVVDEYAVDTTEVTNEMYEQFLAVEFDQAFYDALPVGCEFKDDFTPEDFPNDPDPNLPVVGVDWCDAYAYCDWAGKELCGAIGGGPNVFQETNDWSESQWYRACTQAGIKEYPYGVLYEPTHCNTEDAGLGEVAEVASFPDCEGGFPGLFDMSGNVWEWVNNCNDMDECRRRGGSFYSGVDVSRCGVVSTRERSHRNHNQGFRCCETL